MEYFVKFRFYEILKMLGTFISLNFIISVILMIASFDPLTLFHSLYLSFILAIRLIPSLFIQHDSGMLS